MSSAINWQVASAQATRPAHAPERPVADDGDRRPLAGQLSRTRSNASSARSRCSRSCVAITLVRSSAPPRVTAGYSATLV